MRIIVSKRRGFSFLSAWAVFAWLFLSATFMMCATAEAMQAPPTWNITGSVNPSSALSNAYLYIQYDDSSNTHWGVPFALGDLPSGESSFSFTIELPADIQNIDWYSVFGIYDESNDGVSVSMFGTTADCIVSNAISFSDVFKDSNYAYSESDVAEYLRANNEADISGFGLYFAGYAFFYNGSDIGWYFSSMGDSSTLVNFSDPTYNGTANFTASQVPIPTSALLFGTALAALVGIRRKMPE